MTTRAHRGQHSTSSRYRILARRRHLRRPDVQASVAHALALLGVAAGEPWTGADREHVGDCARDGGLLKASGDLGSELLEGERHDLVGLAGGSGGGGDGGVRD